MKRRKMDATVIPIKKYIRGKGQHFREKVGEECEIISDKLIKETKTPLATLIREGRYRKPSRVPLESLSLVALSEFNTNQVAASKYLLIRTLECAYVAGYCSVHVVEDHSGSIIYLQLRNCIVKDKELDDYFQIGTIMVIKEPFCELVNKSIAIRVDHPTDVIVIRPYDELYQSYSSRIKSKNEIDESDNPLLAEPKPSNAEEWKERGNKLFKAAKYYSAEVAYKLCITEANKSQDETVKSFAMKNLISVYLKLEQFDQAVEMAERVLEQYPDDLKALFRLGRAYYQLREYSKAVKYFENVQQVVPENAKCKRQLARSRSRVKEQSTRNYNIQHLYQQSKEMIRNTGEKKLIDIADYVGALEIKKMDGKSVGVVATQDIKPGTLLVVSKAFQVSSNKESDIVPEEYNNKTLGVKGLQVSSSIYTAVYKNFKTFGKQIYELLPPTVEQRYCDPEKQQEPILDVFEMINLSYTYTQPLINVIHLSETLNIIKHLDNADRGFFTFPSHIKHSCLPNCGNIIYGNVMIIRALWPISKGEEITISHVHPFRRRFGTHPELFKRLDYICDCQLCDFERKEGENAQSLRKKYGAKLRKSYDHALDVKCNAVAVTAEGEYIDDMLTTYNGRSILHTDLFKTYLGVADSFLNDSKCKEALTNVIKAFNCLGFQWDDLEKLASFAEGHNSSAVELKGKVFVGEELIEAVELLTHVFIEKSFFRHHFSEAKMVVSLTNYLVKVVFGDMKMKEMLCEDADKLAHLVRSHKRTGNRKRSLS